MITVAITTPTQVTNGFGRTGVAIWDNSLVTNNNLRSVIVIYGDSTYDMEARANLTQVPGSSTGAAAFPPGLGPGPG